MCNENVKICEVRTVMGVEERIVGSKHSLNKENSGKEEFDKLCQTLAG
jgi:hypothetical protein